jgi:ubiquinone/menaquinone biosynthesis C-methylase UbiE
MMALMGFYGDRVLPRIVDIACGGKLSAPLRQRVCAGLTGEVVEIGFGSGNNIPFYPVTVTRVAAIEPADLGWKLADKRLRESAVPVERMGLDGQRLPFEDGSFDAALSTWTLCTIPDAGTALLEVRRVLRPGGTFHFVEHGLAPEENVRRWQYRMEPLHLALLGGCHVTRPITDLITAAGFSISEIDVFYEDGGPKYAGAMSLGTAAK